VVERERQTEKKKSGLDRGRKAVERQLRKDGEKEMKY
jgi:hypothetical protein